MVRNANRNRNRTEATANQPPAGPEAPAADAAPRGPRRDAPVNPIPAGNAGADADAGTQSQDSAPTRAVVSGAATAPASNTALAVQGQRDLAPAVNARNAFETYGQQMSMTSISGTLIKFNKGDWVTGDDEDLDEGMELVCNMDQLMVGWIKWVDNKPAEQLMGPVAEGYQPQRRNELGDQNQAEWEPDQDGRPRDPWQFSNYIVMKEPGQDASDEYLYTFATSSKGGLGALGQLCKTYGKEMRTRPDDYPIVKLESDYYTHATYGRIYTPILTVVGWEPKAQFEAVHSVATAPAAAAAPPPAPEPAPARRSRRAA